MKNWIYKFKNVWAFLWISTMLIMFMSIDHAPIFLMRGMAYICFITVALYIYCDLIYRPETKTNWLSKEEAKKYIEENMKKKSHD